MFSKRGTKQSTNDCSNRIEKLKNAMLEADAVIVGAGAGLSASAGFVYDGERFQNHFSDFELKYGFHDMYSGGFYPYETLEEYWAYWSRYIFLNRYTDAPKPIYDVLFQLIKNKDYFVLTTNVDHCFQKAGFEKQRLFYTQGDYGLFQCSEPCCQNTYDNEAQVRNMVKAEKDMKIPSEMIPLCPECGKPMAMNLRADSTFVEDEGWHIAAERYDAFLRRSQSRKVLFLELGTGYNTPGIIKYPFWQMTHAWKEAAYACINLEEAAVPSEIRDKSICIREDIGEVFEEFISVL